MGTSEEKHCPFKPVLSALICSLNLIPFPLLFSLIYCYISIFNYWDLKYVAHSLHFVSACHILYQHCIFLSFISTCLNPMKVSWEPWHHKKGYLNLEIGNQGRKKKNWEKSTRASIAVIALKIVQQFILNETICWTVLF